MVCGTMLGEIFFCMNVGDYFVLVCELIDTLECVNIF